MPRDHFLDALTILGTAEQSVLDVRLTAPQARALHQKLTYLQTDNATLRAQHALWQKFAQGESVPQGSLDFNGVTSGDDNG